MFSRIVPALGLALSSLALLGSLSTSSSAAQAVVTTTYPYTLKDLGALTNQPGLNNTPFAVNNSGQVTGQSFGGASFFGSAYLSAPFGGPLRELSDTSPTSTGDFVVGNSVNNGGQVVGTGVVPFIFMGDIGFEDHVFVTGSNGTPVFDLGAGNGLGINNSGQITGRVFTDASHAFIGTISGGLRVLGNLPGSSGSQGNAINDRGQVAGTAIDDQGGEQAFLSGPNGGALRGLGTLDGGFNSRANAVNASGQVTGNSDIADSIHAFLSGPNGGALRDLGTLPGDRSSAGRAVNAGGQVVGTSTGSGTMFGFGRAFLYSNGVMTDLNSLINPASGVHLVSAAGISDTGFITAFSVEVNNNDGEFAFNNHAYLLVPNGPVVNAPKLILSAQAGPLINGQTQITVTLKNTGGDASNVQITQISLSGASAATNTLPTTAASLLANGSLARTFTFPVPSFYRAGVLRVRATFTDPSTGNAGTLDATFRIIVPIAS